MPQKDVPLEQPQEAETQTRFSPLSRPRRHSKRPILFVLPIIGCLVLMAGGGMLLWQFGHSSQSSRATSVQNAVSSGGQKTPGTCSSRLPWDWIAQQLAQRLQLTKTQLKTEVVSGKSVQAIATARGIAAKQLYQMELQLMHAGNVRWRKLGCLSQSDYNDNEQRANAMTPAEMDEFFASFYQS